MNFIKAGTYLTLVRNQITCCKKYCFCITQVSSKSLDCCSLSKNLTRFWYDGWIFLSYLKIVTKKFDKSPDDLYLLFLELNSKIDCYVWDGICLFFMKCIEVLLLILRHFKFSCWVEKYFELWFKEHYWVIKVISQSVLGTDWSIISTMSHVLGFY